MLASNSASESNSWEFVGVSLLRCSKCGINTSNPPIHFIMSWKWIDEELFWYFTEHPSKTRMLNEEHCQCMYKWHMQYEKIHCILRFKKSILPTKKSEILSIEGKVCLNLYYNRVGIKPMLLIQHVSNFIALNDCYRILFILSTALSTVCHHDNSFPFTFQWCNNHCTGQYQAKKMRQ